MKHSLYDGNSVNLSLKPYHKMMGKKRAARKGKNAKATDKNTVVDYSNDPFFIKKDKASVKFLEKHGFPKEFKKRS